MVDTPEPKRGRTNSRLQENVKHKIRTIIICSKFLVEFMSCTVSCITFTLSHVVYRSRYIGVP